MCALSPRQRSRSPGAKQLPARCHPPSPPRPHNRLLLCRAPSTWLPCFAEKRMLQEYVSSVFRCFRGMLQVFQMDIAKVDRDVAYVAMIVHICCKGLLPLFRLCFPDACCKCVCRDFAYFSHIRCIFLFGCCVYLQCFSSVFRCFFFKCFRNLFQVFHLPSDVRCNCFFFKCLLTFSCIVSVCPLGAGRASIRCRGQVLPNQRHCPLPLLLFGAAWAPRGARETEYNMQASVMTSGR
jgi:hypothetical protein